MNSPGRPRFAVILGAPRSGTTWLQRMLAAHPAVATPQETHLFGLYLAPMASRWNRHARRIDENVAAINAGKDPSIRTIGLPTVLAQSDLDEVMRSLLEVTLDRAAAAARSKSPSADMPVSLVIEKTPSNALHVDLINRLSPDCLFIHVIRDPRDVAASMLAASRSWGDRWAPRTPQAAARMWHDHVLGGRQAVQFGDRYLELRYEDLKSDTPAHLGRVLEFLRLDSSCADELAHQQGEFAFHSHLRASLSDTLAEPAAFAGDGTIRHQLKPNQQIVVERQTAALRRELGYGPTARWVPCSTLRTLAVVPASEAATASRRWARAVLRSTNRRHSVPALRDADATLGSAGSLTAAEWMTGPVHQGRRASDRPSRAAAGRGSRPTSTC